MDSWVTESQLSRSDYESGSWEDRDTELSQSDYAEDGFMSTGSSKSSHCGSQKGFRHVRCRYRIGGPYWSYNQLVLWRLQTILHAWSRVAEEEQLWINSLWRRAVCKKKGRRKNKVRRLQQRRPGHRQVQGKHRQVPESGAK